MVDACLFVCLLVVVMGRKVTAKEMAAKMKRERKKEHNASRAKTPPTRGRRKKGKRSGKHVRDS